MPYIALQLKAVSASLNVFLAAAEGGVIGRPVPVFGDLALVVALVLAGFAVAFGTRHTDATEHQDGLMLAIALESVVKLVAFLIVGALRDVLDVRRPRRDHEPADRAARRLRVLRPHLGARLPSSR